MSTLSTDVSWELREAFLPLDISVDELLVHPQDALAFAERFSERFPQANLEVPTVLRELIRLRKIGEAKGGLPRRARKYSGRKPRKAK